MSAPPGDGYGQFPGQQPDPQAQQPYGDQQAAAPQEAAAPGKKKKRGYAAGAFDVATGANAGVGGQLQGAGQFGQPQQPQQPAAPQYGYPQTEPNPAVQNYQYSAQNYIDQQQQQSYAGGYQTADQSFQALTGQPVVPPPGAPIPSGMAQVTQGMNNMQLGGQPQQQAPAQAARAAMNQLYPIDLLNQPFNATELDLPPPPINLPPNVSIILRFVFATRTSLLMILSSRV